MNNYSLTNEYNMIKNKNILSKKYYIDFNKEKNKSVYIKVINEFLNDNSLKIMCDKCYCMVARNYAEQNKYDILDLDYYCNSLGQDLPDMYLFSSQENNHKSLWLMDYGNMNIKPLSTNESLALIITIYKSIVFNVGNCANHLRQIKELKKDILKLKGKYSYNSTIDGFIIHYINDVTFNKLHLILDNRTISFNNNSFMRNELCLHFHGIKDMVRLLNSVKFYDDKDEILSVIVQEKEKKVKNVVERYDNIIQKFKEKA